LTVIGVLLWAAAAGAEPRAESIEGDVAAVEPALNSVSVTRLNPVSGAPESFEVSVGEDAEFEGVEALSDLRVGDSVRLEVTREAGKIEAGSLELTGAAGIEGEAESESETPENMVWGSQRKESLL
jgi:hypothetical protein